MNCRLGNSDENGLKNYLKMLRNEEVMIVLVKKGHVVQNRVVATVPESFFSFCPSGAAALKSGAAALFRQIVRVSFCPFGAAALKSGVAALFHQIIQNASI